MYFKRVFNISPVKVSIDLFVMCFTFFSQTEGQTDNAFIVDISDRKYEDFSKDLIYFKLNPNLTYIYMFFHSRRLNLILITHEIEGLSWSPSIEFIDYIRYTKTITSSLPYPFETNCFDYGNEDYVSEEGCIAKCKLKKWQDEFSDNWPGIYLTSNLTDNYMIDRTGEYLSHEWALDKKIGIECQNECQSNINCYKEDFDLKLRQYNIYSETLCLNILPPRLPDLVVQHMPKVSFEEFVSFIGSLIGLYFGFSIIMLSDVCSVAVKYVVHNISNNQYFRAKLFLLKNIVMINKLVLTRKQNKIVSFQ